MKSKILIESVAGGLLLTLMCHSSRAQSAPSSLPLPDMAGSTLPLNSNRAGSVAVYVRTEDGEPLSTLPKVTIIPPSDTVPIPLVQKAGQDVWVFNGMELGDYYEVQVQASGYHTELRPVRILESATASTSIIVFMRSPNDELAFHPPAGNFVLSPEAEKETEKGSKDLDSGNVNSAQKHFAKALQLDPQNPYVNYLMGMRFLLNGELPAAKPYLEKSVSIDSKQAPALIALGTLRFRQEDYAGAIQVLKPAAQMAGTKWKVHSMLAGAYLKQSDFQNARDEAQKALSLGGSRAGTNQLVLGEALASLGQRQKAVTALQAFLKQYPNDSSDAAVRSWIPELEKPESVPFAPSVGLLVAAPAVDLPPRENWAPPDVDATKPFVVSGASCPLPKVLKAAGDNAAQFVTDLQKFSSTEQYQAVEIKRNTNLEKPESRSYRYMAFIEQPAPNIIHVDEYRGEGIGAKDMPGQLVDMGAPALVLVFHPLFQSDFNWSCEGLGEWHDTPAWVVHFEQQPDRPSRIQSFQSPSFGAFPLPMKGRAWVSEDSGEVMHAEFDLVKQIPEIQLGREHFAINYQPVAFKDHRITLWLPENVDVYYQYRGHYLHHYHHFSNFKLFWTGATQKDDLSKPAKSRK